MASKTFRKSQLIAFDNAAAGHDGVLSDPSGSLIVKPCKQSEIDFYETVAVHPDFQRFVPVYHGQLSLGDKAQGGQAIILPGETSIDHASADQANTLPVVQHAWKPSGGGKIETDLALVLENIAAGLTNPNVLDVKLGTQLWDEDAPVEKRAKLDKIAAETTSKPLGFRIAGMKTWHGAEPAKTGTVIEGGYKVFDKHYGRRFTSQTVPQAFEEFFLMEQGIRPNASLRKVIRRFIEELELLVSVLETKECRMYSASLLFVYEGHAEMLRKAFKEERDIMTSHGLLKDEQAETLDDIPSGAAASTKTTLEDDSKDGIEGESGHEADNMKLPTICNVKLIDFAHARWTPGKGQDENVLFGMRNVIQQLQDLLI